MKRILLAGLFSFLAVYLSFVGFLFINQRSYMYFPPKASASLPGQFELIEAGASDGITLRAAYAKPENETAPVILIFHGNGEDISNYAPDVDLFLENGWGVLLAEYRGYWSNPGDPSEEGIFKDARAYMTFLERHGIMENHIISYGRSLGSGPAAYIASKYQDIMGLILVVPFDNMASVAALHYSFIPLLDYLVWDKYENSAIIGKVKAPKLFVLAGNDEIVSKELGEKLAGLASKPKEVRIIQKAGHNTIYNYGAGTIISDFIKALTHEANDKEVNK